MNSGIQFRSEIKDASDTCHVTDLKTPERVHGYQMEIDPSSRAWSGGIYDEARRGWLYPMEYNPGAKALLKITSGIITALSVLATAYVHG